MTPTREDIAYAAGLFDGEGCVNITANRRNANHPSYRVQVVVAMTDHPVLLWLQERWGGNIYTQKRSAAHHRPGWQWHLAEAESRVFLETIRLHIKIKGPATDNALPFLWLKRDNPAKPGAPFPHEVYTSLRELHKRHVALALGHQKPKVTGVSKKTSPIKG
jgi:hypothetical protein